MSLHICHLLTLVSQTSLCPYESSVTFQSNSNIINETGSTTACWHNHLKVSSALPPSFLELVTPTTATLPLPSYVTHIWRCFSPDQCWSLRSSLSDSQFNQPSKVHRNDGCWPLMVGIEICKMWCWHMHTYSHTKAASNGRLVKKQMHQERTSWLLRWSPRRAQDQICSLLTSCYCQSLRLWNGSFSSLCFSGWAGSLPPPSVVYLSGNSGAAAGTKWLPAARCWERWELATQKPLTENNLSHRWFSNLE